MTPMTVSRVQAAWEFHRKVVKRPVPLRGRSDWVMDPSSLEDFLKFVARRTHLDVPDWWRKCLLHTDVDVGSAHGFLEGPRLKGVRRTLSTMWITTAGDLVKTETEVVWKNAGDEIGIPKPYFEIPGEALLR